MLPPTNLNGPVNSLNAQLRIPDGSEQQYYSMHPPNGDGISPSAHSGPSHSGPGPDSMAMPSLGKMPSLATANSSDEGPDLNSMRNNMEAQLAGGHDIPSGSPFYNGRNMMRPTSDGMGNHMSNAAALSSLSNDYYRMNGAGNNFANMQAHFPAAGQYGGYAPQQDPYYQNLTTYAQGLPAQNFHDPSAVSDESSLKQFNNNGKRAFYGSDIQQVNPNPGYGEYMQQEKRLRPDLYSTGMPANSPYGDYGGNFAPHQQMMNMPQDGMFFNGQLPQAAMQQYSSIPSMPPPEAERPKKSSKKKQPSGDMPRRPLTAYNFFFSEEREFILAQIPDNDESGDSKANKVTPVKKESSPAKTEGEGDDKKDEKEKEEEVKEVDPVEKILASMRTLTEEEKEELHKKVRENTERMLTIHKQSERVKKPHKKVHGKIAFRHLAKIVGSRWRNLTPEKKKYYEEIAAKDSNRYNEDLAAYNKSK